MSSGFDVVVVGAGPAGSIAALVLARSGARVALADKAAFPRDKACGDLVGPRGVQVLADFALDMDTCLGILGECGFLPTGRIGVVNLLHIPFDLSAEELERFLREKGAETCGLNTMGTP